MIIANGDFPTRMHILDIVEAADRVVCCDGAFEKYLRWRMNQPSRSRAREAIPSPQSVPEERTGGENGPVVVVGDGDSLPSDVLRQAEAAGVDFVRVKVEEQEMNDLTKSVRYVMGQLVDGHPAKIDILGATGLREDHTLGNISLLAYYMEHYPNAAFRMMTDHGTFLPVQGEACISTHPGQQVSIFSLTPDVPVSVDGLKWPIDSRCLTQWWQGTLNEATADSFTVCGGTLLVYLTL